MCVVPGGDASSFVFPISPLSPFNCLYPYFAHTRFFFSFYLFISFYYVFFEFGLLFGSLCSSYFVSLKGIIIRRHSILRTIFRFDPRSERIVLNNIIFRKSTLSTCARLFIYLLFQIKRISMAFVSQ